MSALAWQARYSPWTRIAFEAGTELPAELTEQWLVPGRYAMATHVGPCEELGDAWARLMGEWLPASGERLGKGIGFEIYRNTPGNAAKHELRTELYLSLAD